MAVNSIFLKEMPFTLAVGLDAWRRPGKPQPVLITFQVHNVHTVEEAASLDDMTRSLDYGKLYKSIARRLDSIDSFPSVRKVADDLLSTLNGPHLSAGGEITLPKASLRAEEGVVYTFEQDRNPRSLSEYETLSVRGIRCVCIIGVNPHERREKQVVVIRIDFLDVPSVVSVLGEYHDIIPAVVEIVEESSFETIEALANAVCREVTLEWGNAAAEVTVEKPFAIPGIGAPGVRIRRRKSFYARPGLNRARTR